MAVFAAPADAGLRTAGLRAFLSPAAGALRLVVFFAIGFSVMHTANEKINHKLL
jgi:hypothetical protein